MGREEEVRRLGDQPGGCGTGTIRRNASVGLVEVAGLGGGVCVCVSENISHVQNAGPIELQGL